MYGDGNTNLGADDAAGITIILLAIRALKERGLAHNPIILLFTVQEEIGLKGAQAFDPARWGVKDGIVFDNAGESGYIIVRGSAYIAFDVTIKGRGGHPGKDLAGTQNALEIFKKVPLELGVYDDQQTRLSIGIVKGEGTRNQILETLHISGELRTLLDQQGQEAWKARIFAAFHDTAKAMGGTAEVEFDPHGSSYTVDLNDPFLQMYRRCYEERGRKFIAMDTFVGSDTNALRSRMNIFTVSTGARNEHTFEEFIALHPLVEIAETAVAVATNYS
jgi:tripeptide aminopeptidase